MAGLQDNVPSISKNGLGGSGGLCLPCAASLTFCRWKALSQQQLVSKAFAGWVWLVLWVYMLGCVSHSVCVLGPRRQLFLCCALLVTQPQAGLQALCLGQCHLPDFPLGRTSLAPFSKHCLLIWGLWAGLLLPAVLLTEASVCNLYPATGQCILVTLDQNYLFGIRFDLNSAAFLSADWRDILDVNTHNGLILVVAA